MTYGIYYEIWEHEWSRVPGQEMCERMHRKVETIAAPLTLYTARMRRDYWQASIPPRERNWHTFSIRQRSIPGAYRG